MEIFLEEELFFLMEISPEQQKMKITKHMEHHVKKKQIKHYKHLSKQNWILNSSENWITKTGDRTKSNLVNWEIQPQCAWKIISWH